MRHWLGLCHDGSIRSRPVLRIFFPRNFGRTPLPNCRSDRVGETAWQRSKNIRRDHRFDRIRFDLPPRIVDRRHKCSWALLPLLFAHDSCRLGRTDNSLDGHCFTQSVAGCPVLALPGRDHYSTEGCIYFTGRSVHSVLSAIVCTGYSRPASTCSTLSRSGSSANSHLRSPVLHIAASF